MDWTPPADLFAGRTVAILAGGPSMTKAAADEVRHRGWAAIAVNNTGIRFKRTNGQVQDPLAAWADVLYAADALWWKTYAEAAQDFAGLKVHSQKFTKIDGVHFMPVSMSGSGGNSALHAAVLAKKAGASRVLLLGVDLRDDEVTHWHGPHLKSLRNANVVQFRAYRAGWEQAARGLLKGLPIINCNPRSAVTAFPRLALEAVPE